MEMISNNTKSNRWILGIALLLVTVSLSSAAFAEVFDVTINGEVEFNQVNNGTLGSVNAGDLVTLSFQVDSTNFVDSPNFPTRGYVIDEATFLLDFGSAALGLQNPFPTGQTPYFVLRDNDPAVDGFFISRSVDNPIGVPIDQNGQFTQFSNNFLVTYGGDALFSLNIEDAVGDYDFTGLMVFNWTIDDGPFNATGMIFSDMSISPAGDGCANPLGDVNQDGVVNLLDVAPFVDAINETAFLCEADTNKDGVVDLLDVAPFIALLSDG